MFSGFSVAINFGVNYHISTFYLLLTSGPLTVANRPASAKFTPGSNLLLRHWSRHPFKYDKQKLRIVFLSKHQSYASETEEFCKLKGA